MKPGMMGVAVASAGPYTNHLHLTAVTHFFTGQMLFLMPVNSVKALKAILI